MARYWQFSTLFGRWLGLCLLLGLLASGVHAESPADRVVILANSSDPDSLRLAAYYAAKRAVPAANIIALPLSREETIGWPEFIRTLWQPLQDELVRRNWIEATATAQTDEIGRKKCTIYGHKISYLVICRGVPLRLSHNPAFLSADAAGQLRPEFRTNQAAVDSELSLLAQAGTAVNGPLPNPLFGVENPTLVQLAQVVKTARLDGPAYDDARQLVDSALTGEQQGLLGRSYVDLSGPDPIGDRWLGDTGKILGQLGFDGDTDPGAGTFPAGARFDAPVLYFGWYAPNLNGPMALPGFRFPPGAIAVHIHSYSAETLRSASTGWCGALVARGVAATVGNVFEPYLQFLHRPDGLLRALAEGKTLGDAAYFALPALSWQSILIGDPLYRPFAIGPNSQWRQLRLLPPALVPYAVLRRVHLLDQAKRTEEARQTLRAGFKIYPGLVLGLPLAQQLASEGNAAMALRMMEYATAVEHFEREEIPLARQAAQFFTAHRANQRALAIYRSLLRTPPETPEVLMAILIEAHEAAVAAGDSDLAVEWQKRLSALAAVTPATK